MNAELSLAMVSHLPTEGDITAWKKCRGNVIVKLLIPDGVKRSHGAGRKCRSESVVVLEVIGAEEGISGYDPAVIYRKGETVSVPNFDTDRWNECASGIHWFITRLEAEAYSL